MLNFKGLEPKVLIPNVQELIDQETAEGEKLKSRKPRRGMTWDDYYLASEVCRFFKIFFIKSIEILPRKENYSMMVSKFI